MKKFLAIFAILGLMLMTACSSSTSAVQTVDPAAWMTAVAQTGTTVIDVRTPEEYSSGHVAGAINIDVEGSDFDAGIAALNKSGTYALYCHSGRRSQIAADKMAGTGFTHVTNLKGGIADLQAAGAQIVTG